MEHVDDLLNRFGNRCLCDTVERVGKDPLRKLSKNDRLVGALKLCLKQNSYPVHIIIGIAAALCFGCKDEKSSDLSRAIPGMGPETVLQEICGLEKGTAVYCDILEFYHMFKNLHNLSTDEIVLYYY